MKSRIVAKALALTGTRGLVASLTRPDGVLILNYHRIGDGGDSPFDRELWSASAEAFDEQVAFLASHCDVISPADIPAALASRRGRHVAITFDDGYRDNYEIAYPILRRHGVPGTFFVATGFIDKPRIPWWDEIAHLVRASPLRRLDAAGWLDEPLDLGPGGDRTPAIRTLLKAYKRLPSAESARFLAHIRGASGVDDDPAFDRYWMDWDMLREMRDHGMTIGGHTVSHPVLSRLSADEQCDELTTCAMRLREELHTPMDFFAYPVGARDAFDANTRACLADLGVRYAFSYYGGFATRDSDRYDMPRVAIETHVDTDLFRAMVQLPHVFCRRPYT
ncbi:polysaccharide deacetylase family protein [Dokdonella sp. MW10]|uniref:polysaccharide deacetylase family protein n=1 Tax=Dokdonella sp. MW10 TaxID=2992926 RepID=UPI003F812851